MKWFDAGTKKNECPFFSFFSVHSLNYKGTMYKDMSLTAGQSPSQGARSLAGDSWSDIIVNLSWFRAL